MTADRRRGMWGYAHRERERRRVRQVMGQLAVRRERECLFVRLGTGHLAVHRERECLSVPLGTGQLAVHQEQECLLVPQGTEQPLAHPVRMGAQAVHRRTAGQLPTQGVSRPDLSESAEMLESVELGEMVELAEMVEMAETVPAIVEASVETAAMAAAGQDALHPAWGENPPENR